jgi:hypothetical protein
LSIEALNGCWWFKHSSRSGFSRPQDSTCINHCYDSVNSDVSSKKGAVIGTRKFHRGQHWHQTHE